MSPIPIQITQSGGTNEAAIATQASHAAIFLNQNARNAMSHDAKAIPKSIIVGSILIKISSVSCVNGRSQVIITAVQTLTITLNIRSQSPLKKSLLFPVVVAKETA